MKLEYIRFQHRETCFIRKVVGSRGQSRLWKVLPISKMKRSSITFGLLTAVFTVSMVTGHGQQRLHPVILVPGDGGSQLEAKLNKPSTVAWYCYKTTDYWYNLWLNIELLLPKFINCLADNMRLVYNRKNRTTSNSPGVEIRVPGFGETDTVEWFDPSQYSWTIYFHDIVTELVKMGYEKNKSIRGAPYDFRKAPNELGDYFRKLKDLIENTYTRNSNTSVVLLAHSMGNPMVLYFLNRMSDAWKAKFIKSFISLAGVWGGAVKSVRLMISGDNLDVPIINPINVRRQQRSMPSTAWLMPTDEFWHPDEVLVVSPARNYSLKDIKQLFNDINYTTGYMMWEDTKDLVKPIKAPGVELYCLHGNNCKTPGQLVYTNETWQKDLPKIIPDDGDGTVNIRSLHGCLKFTKQQKQPVYHKEFDKVEHMETLWNDDVIAEIRIILAAYQKTGKSVE